MSADRDPAIACRAVSVRYGTVEAVCDATLEVPPGEAHVLLGASGSGKTTLLRAIAGLEAACAGRIDLAGRTVDDADRPAAAVPPEGRGVGLVFQDYALFPHLTVEANVAYGRGADPARVRDALERVGLTDLARRLPSELSGGQQQRVALARALAVGPSVLLLDEPFSGIDERLRRTLRERTLEVIRDSDLTALFVTHAVDEAFSIADRISVMSGGRILQTGAPEDLYRAPADATVALSVGDACLVPAILEDGGFAVGPLGRLPVRSPGDPAAGTRGRIVIRPEAIRLLGSSGDGPAVEGRIVRRVFLGEATEIDLSVGDPGGDPIRLRARLAEAPVGPGEGAVRLGFSTPLPFVPDA